MLPPSWPHQIAEFEQNKDVPKLMLCWSPRLGKSRAALDWILHVNQPRVLVTAPLVVCTQWAELCRQAGLTVIEGFSPATTHRAAKLLSQHKEGVFITNDDRLSTLQTALLRWSPSVYVGDESHRFRGVATKRAKAMRKIAQSCRYVRLLTGTPTPNHMGNLWGQLVAIDPSSWGTSYEKFAQKYLIRDELFKNKVLGVLHVEELRAKLLNNASILRREDVFGADQWQTLVRTVALPPKALNLYKQIVKEWVVEDSLSTGERFDATHKLKRMVRLQQLTSGWLPDEDGEVHHIHTGKIDTVFADLDEIIDSSEKCVIFHRFTTEGDSYYERAKNTYGSDKVFRISGSVGSGDRAESVRRFAAATGGAVIVVQTQSGGIGISLAAARHAFFVSQSANFDDEQQARDRIYSPGDPKCVSFYRVPGTIDGYIARLLERKQDVHQAIVHADVRDIAFDYSVDMTTKGII